MEEGRMEREERRASVALDDRYLRTAMATTEA